MPNVRNGTRTAKHNRSNRDFFMGFSFLVRSLFLSPACRPELDNTPGQLKGKSLRIAEFSTLNELGGAWRSAPGWRPTARRGDFEGPDAPSLPGCGLRARCPDSRALPTP